MKTLPTVTRSGAPRFSRHTGIAAPLLRRDIDPDRATHATADLDLLKYISQNRENQELIFNQPPFRRASILCTDVRLDRETAPTASDRLFGDLDIRVVIAPFFGTTTLSAAMRQWIMLVPLAEVLIEQIALWIRSNPEIEVSVDLGSQLIDIPGWEPLPFVTHPRLRSKLLNGLDDIGELLVYAEQARDFRRADRLRRPWLYDPGMDGG